MRVELPRMTVLMAIGNRLDQPVRGPYVPGYPVLAYDLAGAADGAGIREPAERVVHDRSCCCLSGESAGGLQVRVCCV